jgi:hypothetical protein
MKFLRLILLMCITLGATPVVQANWLARASARIKNLVVRSGLASASRAEQLNCTVEQAPINAQNPKIVSKKEMENFRCYRGPFCGKTEMESSGGYFSFDGKTAGSDWEKTIICPTCNTYITSSSEQSVSKESEALPENCINVEFTVEGEEPKKPEASAIKSLPVTSMPEKGFYARVKAMFKSAYTR